ncbi:MAG: hypothetical protein M5U07_00095 [Xanthobacteraceae bacterium]|nr:hypothetical protein [Xanthobacteraceae bacterium]
MAIGAVWKTDWKSIPCAHGAMVVSSDAVIAPSRAVRLLAMTDKIYARPRGTTLR